MDPQVKAQIEQKIMAVLTENQRSEWRSMLGAKFTFSPPPQGGQGRGGQGQGQGGRGGRGGNGGGGGNIPPEASTTSFIA